MHCPLDHPMKARDVEFGNVLVLSFDFEPERRSEILLVADHHIDKRRKLAIHGNGPRLSTDRFPQRLAIIEIVRDDRAVLARGLHRFTRHGRRRFREGTENTAGMKPARAFRAEDLFPIDIAGFQLRDGRVTTIGTTGSRAHAKAALGEVETVTNGASYAIKLHPLQVWLVHAALINQILDQPAHRVVSERRDDRSIHTETSLQPTRDVVLTPTFPNLKVPRGRNTSFTRIEP